MCVCNALFTGKTGTSDVSEMTDLTYRLFVGIKSLNNSTNYVSILNFVLQISNILQSDVESLVVYVDSKVWATTF